MRSEITIAVHDKRLTARNGRYLLTIDLQAGTFGCRWEDGSALGEAYAAVRLSGVEGLCRTDEAAAHTFDEAEVRDVADAIGRGRVLTVEHRTQGGILLRQQFTVYEGQPFWLTRLEARNGSGDGGEELLASAYMAPLVAEGGAFRLPDDEALRGLRVPFDNDKWVRYESVAMPGELESYEATAVYAAASRRGLVAGSITHDVWKTGLRVAGSAAGGVGRLEAYGGAAGELTRDTIGHGLVQGRELLSPLLFVGSFPDYRRGLEAFGKANSAVEPALPWEHGVPFGWNSWSAVGGGLDYDVYVATSDFLKEMQEKGFENEDTVYVNFDSFWTGLTPEEFESAIAHVRANGQKAGIYWTPFAFWGKDFDKPVEGTDGKYAYGDLLLRDREGSVLPELDGGLAIDPTHPGNLMRTDYYMKKFVDSGFEYIKLDFLGHGALEGRHHDPAVHTGIQAYRFGMDLIRRRLDPAAIGRPFHVNLSIAPLFPHGYGHSRRISCDAFGKLEDTAYMLNSLTYGWWMNGNVYAYNDPDHTVLYKSFNQEPTSLHEGRSRFLASVIAGTVLLMGDDFRQPEARSRAERWIAHAPLLELARKGRTFVPVEGDGVSSEWFALEEENGSELYLAVFNYDAEAPAVRRVSLERLGVMRDGAAYTLTDLWEGTVATLDADAIETELQPGESKAFKLTVG